MITVHVTNCLIIKEFIILAAIFVPANPLNQKEGIYELDEGI
jgi:hypothetical protein